MGLTPFAAGGRVGGVAGHQTQLDLSLYQDRKGISGEAELARALTALTNTRQQPFITPIPPFNGKPDSDGRVLPKSDQ